MVKAYLDKMNRSEIFLVMTAGMATVAGGVLAAYVEAGGDDPVQRLFFAKHLLTASVMAAPSCGGRDIPSSTDRTHRAEDGSEHGTRRLQLLDAMSNGTRRTEARCERGRHVAGLLRLHRHGQLHLLKISSISHQPLGGQCVQRKLQGPSRWSSSQLPRAADVADRCGQRGHHPHRTTRRTEGDRQ